MASSAYSTRLTHSSGQTTEISCSSHIILDWHSRLTCDILEPSSLWGDYLQSRRFLQGLRHTTSHGHHPPAILMSYILHLHLMEALAIKKSLWGLLQSPADYIACNLHVYLWSTTTRIDFKPSSKHALWFSAHQVRAKSNKLGLTKFVQFLWGAEMAKQTGGLDAVDGWGSAGEAWQLFTSSPREWASSSLALQP